MPDTLAPVTQPRHLLPRYQASAPTVNGGRTKSSAALSSTRRRRDPIQLMNHRDPVTNSHLPKGKSGSVAKARTAARDVPEIKGRYP